MKTVWLASYPKSGNTWMRVLLSNLLFPAQAPVNPSRLPLNNLIASARQPFVDALGFSPALLTAAEAAQLRPVVDRQVARDWGDLPCVRKAHDAYTLLPDGQPLMGAGPDFGAIYLLRNPWDVAVSLANHFGINEAAAVAYLLEDRTISPESTRAIGMQLPQRLDSWARHVLGWLEAPMELLLVRYERLKSDPLTEFRRVVRFLGLPHGDDALVQAIEASAFERLQRIEEETGFREALRDRGPFFRSGKSGDGLERLSEKQVEALRGELERIERKLSESTLETTA